MDVRLLVVENCPAEAPAAAVLREALTDLGLADVPVHTDVVTTQQHAEQLGFVGSPTVLINGTDPFATAEQKPGLACRVYQGEAGPTAVPNLHLLRQALKQARDSHGPCGGRSRGPNNHSRPAAAAGGGQADSWSRRSCSTAASSPLSRAAPNT